MSYRCNKLSIINSGHVLVRTGRKTEMRGRCFLTERHEGPCRVVYELYYLDGNKEKVKDEIPD